MQCSSVDLPQPLLPTMLTNSRSRTSTLMPLSAYTERSPAR